MSKFFLHTFGCRCNQADSAAIRSSLCRESMSETDSCREAELIVINSCTVTGRADQQVRQALRKFHRENPAARLVVTGCYAERDPRALASLDGVSIVAGNAEKSRLVDLVRGPTGRTAGEVRRSPLDGERTLRLEDPAAVGSRTRPLVKLQDGCDARCSYCIVPSVRGPGRSAPPEEILRTVQELVGLGYQEIVLTGVNLGTYGRSLGENASLPALLRAIVQMPGLGRVRLSSIEPMRFDREIIGIAADSPAFARHFHVPLQSGSDRILRRMRRPYRAGQFLDLLHFIDSRLPSVALGSDVMVGFPGETEDDFAATTRLLEQAPLAYLHVFPFSPRPGTDAARMGEPVEPRTSRERVSILRALSRRKSLAFRRRFLGCTLPAITLAKEEKLGSSVVLTDNYIHARVPGLRAEPNRLVQVRILQALPEATVAALQA
jgi:threonylcarbamoyladenosine tRNA methylthiotransferase MtaB